MHLPRHLTTLLLLAGMIAMPAHAGTGNFPRQVGAIAEAEAAELTRLEAAMAATTDTALILSLQRCVTHVKLASRLALHEAQLESTDDEQLQERITTLAIGLRDSIRRLEPDLPRGYRFEPLPASIEEASSCDD